MVRRGRRASWRDVDVRPLSQIRRERLARQRKIYAALTRRHRLLLKLPPARVTELLKARRAERMESGGRVMHGWITLAPDDKATWIALSDEARQFVANETKPKRKSP